MNIKNEWLELYFNITPDIVYFIDLEGRLQHWNAALEKLCGLTQDKMKGRSCLEFVCDQDKPVVEADVQKIFANGSYTNTYRFIRSDGTLVPFHCNGTVTFNKNGEPDGFAGLGRDISEQNLAEEKLSQLHQFSNDIIGSLPGIFYMLDQQGRFIHVNSQFIEVTGYSKNELDRLTVPDLFEEENKSLIAQKMQEVFEKGDAYAEAELITKSGQKIPYYFTGHRTSIDGQSYLVGLGTDITERKQSELRDKALVWRTRVLMQSTTEGIHILDDQGNIIEANDAFCRHLGYTQSEILQLSVFDFEAKLTADEVRTNIKNLLDSHAIFESVHRRKDGTLVAVEITVSGLELNEQKCLFCLSRDITKRKQEEQRLNDSLMFNQTILDESPFGILVSNASGQCVMVNDAYIRMTGGTVEEVLKQNFRNKDTWKRFGLLDCANQALATEKTIQRDIAGVTSFGKEAVLDCVFAPVRISGKPHLMLITHDISRRIKAERALTESLHKLEEKELTKTRFFAAAGHDLRQPLTAVNLFLDALKITEPTPKQDKIIQRLDQAMSTFGGLLDSLLNISKLDSGVIKPEYAPINVTEVFNLLEQSLAPMASEKQLGFKLYFPMKETLVVLSDIGLLNSALMNIAFNAIKFTSKGAILISARKRGSDVLFQVWDTGIGISGGHIEHIFDEFYQINNPQRDRTSGLGLGLAIAKRAVTLLGSKITCRSQIGRGSVFEFRLPLDGILRGAMQQTVIEASHEDVASLSFVQGKRFVVVEDDLLVTQALIQSLEGLGGEVECFHSAEDALHHVNIGYADYYIVDYMLGGALNGVEFLNLLRQKLDKPINAVLMTGDTSTTFIQKVVYLDWPVLYKPVNTFKLISCLNSSEDMHV